MANNKVPTIDEVGGVRRRRHNNVPYVPYTEIYGRYVGSYDSDPKFEVTNKFTGKTIKAGKLRQHEKGYRPVLNCQGKTYKYLLENQKGYRVDNDLQHLMPSYDSNGNMRRDEYGNVYAARLSSYKRSYNNGYIAGVQDANAAQALKAGRQPAKRNNTSRQQYYQDKANRQGRSSSQSYSGIVPYNPTFDKMSSDEMDEFYDIY